MSLRDLAELVLLLDHKQGLGKVALVTLQDMARTALKNEGN